MGDVISDLQGRRGMVLGMSSEKGFEVIKARVPLAEMNKYSTALSSLTGGRAMYNMKFSEYSQVPGEVQDAVIGIRIRGRRGITTTDPIICITGT